MAVLGKDANDDNVSLATEVAGVESGTHRPVHVVAKSALPTGASTAANQSTTNDLLTDMRTLLQAAATEAELEAVTNALGVLIVRIEDRLGELGQKTMAGSTPVAIASDQGAVPVSVGGSLPAGDNNIGNVDIVTLPALPAGTNNIGDVDVLSLPALPAGANAIGTVGVTSMPATSPTAAKQDEARDALLDGFGATPPMIGGGNTVAETEAGSASGSAVALSSTGFFEFQCDEESSSSQKGLYIGFGTSSGMSAVTAANGIWIQPGETKQWKIPTGTTHFKLIRKGTADATLKHYKCGA